MSYTVTQLVTNSYYLSSVVAPGLETVTGEQLNEGLDLLNFCISDLSLDFRKIPYYTTYAFAGIIGQETYFVPGLVEVETLTFFINSIRYSMINTYRKPYFGSSRANDINSLPFCYEVERVLNGSNISVYFWPDQEYPFELHGRFILPQVSLNQDLTLNLELFYINYLRHYLAKYICAQYNIDMPIQAMAEFRRMEADICDMTQFDYSMTKMSCMQKRSGFNYADANLGHGWRP